MGSTFTRSGIDGSIMSRVYESHKGGERMQDKLVSALVIGAVVVAMLMTAKHFGVQV